MIFLSSGFRIALALAQARAASATPEVPPELEKPHSLSVIALGGESILRTFRGSPDRGHAVLAMTAIELERFWSRRIQVCAELAPLIWLKEPKTRSGKGRQTAIATAADLNLRYFPGRSEWKAQPYVELGAGPSYASRRVPSVGTRWNALTQGGVGLTLLLRSGRALVAGFQWVHFSNAGFGKANPGWNFGNLLVGWRASFP